VSILIVLGLVAVAFALGLHFGGAPSSETAALAATSPQLTPSADASTASTSPSVASGAPFASPPLSSDFVRTFDPTKVIEALPGGATCVGGSPGSWIAPETSSNPDETFVKTWLTSCPIALGQRDAFLSQVLGAIAPVDNPIRDGAGGVMAVTPYEEGGFVGSVALTARASVDGLEIDVTLEERPAPIGGPTISGPGLSPGSGFWTATASMVTPRSGHTATLLPSGKVLVAGGESGNVAMASAELYDPNTGTWTATGTMVTPRFGHTATLLPNGKVLVAGGIDGPFGSGTELASAELYDPASGTWADTGSMHARRIDHTATLLPDGKVLVAGGIAPQGTALASAELYDPASGTWTPTGPMGSARYAHTATLLGDGDVLVAGGAGGPNNSDDGFWKSAEVYHPATGSWTATGEMDGYRLGSAATLLSGGRVLVAGGGTYGGRVPFVSAELYDPTSGSWTATGSTQTLREFSTATLLPDGHVLLAGGGLDGGLQAPYAEVYDPSIGTWSSTGTMIIGRADPTATLLPNGTVLVTGGRDQAVSGSALSSAELYGPAAGR
jgi:WD40 repeat protein